MKPRYKAAQGRLGKVVAARLLPGTDLIQGIERICEDNGVKYAVVGCAIGSLSKSTFLIVMPKKDEPEKIAYSSPIEISGPIEFLGGQGIVCKDEKGETLTHFHASLTDKSGRVYGGHLVKGGNPTLVTIDLVIIEVKDVKFLRKYDEETGFVNFSPETEETPTT